MNYVDYAKDCLKMPSDFGWWGSDDMFKTWGLTGIATTGVSDIAEKSNFDSVIAHLQYTFGDQFDDNFDIVNLNHWACGSVQQLSCRILFDEIPLSEITEDDLTIFFTELVDVMSVIELFGILDEEDYHSRCDKESAKLIEELFGVNSDHYYWYQSANKFYGHCIEIDEFGYEVIRWLNENNYSVESHLDDGTPIYLDNDLIVAIYHLELDNRKDLHSDELWSEWEKENPNEYAIRYNKRWENAGQLKLQLNN